MQNPVVAIAMVIGGSAALLNSVKAALRTMPGSQVVACKLKLAGTAMAKYRPFAVVLDSDLYAFDPTEFEALARDVAAQLVVIDADEADEAELTTLLTLRLRQALESRHR